jgi:hypothetical protein
MRPGDDPHEPKFADLPRREQIERLRALAAKRRVEALQNGLDGFPAIAKAQRRQASELDARAAELERGPQ